MMDNWQPIETAPKDRTILACDPVGYLYAIVYFVNGAWTCVDYRGMGMDVSFIPTIWHPLPAPPAADRYAA